MCKCLLYVSQNIEILTFMASLSLLAKYRCLFSKHSTAEKQIGLRKMLHDLQRSFVLVLPTKCFLPNSL